MAGCAALADGLKYSIMDYCMVLFETYLAAPVYWCKIE